MKIPADYWKGDSLLALRLPWLTPDAIRALWKIANGTMRVLEFGAGGSTLFFSDKCRSVLTWEPSAPWRNKIQGLLGNAKNAKIVSDIEEAYNSGAGYDLVMVDSNGTTTNRPAICQKAIHLVRPGGWFILDNYSRYNLDFLKKWTVFRYNDRHWSGSGTLIALALCS